MAKKKASLIRSEEIWEIILDRNFREDLKYWVKQDRKVTLRLLTLVDAISTDPFTGIGKPEPLKPLGSNLWSRRLTQEHRLVYFVADRKVYLLGARHHY
ncbi:MAG: Txe/YoeB family addiction module toxin [Cyanobacteria bacterium P01_A01_bin.17]